MFQRMESNYGQVSISVVQEEDHQILPSDRALNYVTEVDRRLKLTFVKQTLSLYQH